MSAAGARSSGGRWNNKGIPVLYCATSESLGMLELRVHSPHPYPRTRLKVASKSSLGILVPSVIASEERPSAEAAGEAAEVSFSAGM
jgi:hypothetical protein